MKLTMKMAKSYSLDPETVEYVEKTKGKLSASERVNQLLRRAIVAEQYQLLEQEAAAFFAGVGAEEREEAAAYLDATTESLKRE